MLNIVKAQLALEHMQMNTFCFVLFFLCKVAVYKHLCPLVFNKCDLVLFNSYFGEAQSQ